MLLNVTTMASNNLELKLKQVLFKFLDANFKISDDTCFEKLLTHLSAEQSDTSTANLRIICLDWLEHFLHYDSPDASILSFAVRLVAVIASTESGFQSLQFTSIVNRLQQLLSSDTTDSSIKSSYILLLLSLVKHDQGCQHIIQHAWWQDVVTLTHEARSIYIVRDGQRCITELLTRLEKSRTEVCEEILEKVLRPLLATPTEASLIKAVDRLLMPSLKLANNILETCLAGDQLIIPDIMLTKFSLESRIWELLAVTKDDAALTENLSKLLVLVYFAHFRQSYDDKIKSDAITEADLEDLGLKVCALLSHMIPKKDINNLMKVALYSHMSWKKFFRKMDKTALSNNWFENQMITLQLMPLITNLASRTTESECLDSYTNKLFFLTSTETQRACYAVRASLFTMDLQLQHDLTRYAILSILQMEHIMHRDRAVIVFQALMYKLKDFVPDMGASPDVVGNANVTLYPELLSAVLQSLASLITCYSITWRESVETICLFNFTQQLLKDPNITAPLSVLGLKLIQVAITKFMPPNLALLMDTLEGSTINQLGPLIKCKLNNCHWEVRDSALQVLQVVASLANIKFPAFQEHVIENKLCSETLRVACNDGESYVRASALKCLAQMVRVRAFWDRCLSLQEVPRKVMLILQTESEGIVRREAASLMKEMYQHHHIPKSMMSEVFRVMSRAVVGDLYWEVEVNALGFWECVIERHMADQGMIDGAFPAVTFSKEHRKIVTLTPDVVVVRIGKALTELEQLGCLQVLLTALEDCDLKVVHKAAEILSSLYKTMSAYGVLASAESGKLVFNSGECSSKTTLVGASQDAAVFKKLAPDTYDSFKTTIPNFHMADEARALDKTMEEEFFGHRADKRKLNSETAVSRSEAEEIGFSDRAPSPRAGFNNSEDSIALAGHSTQKLNKIFKIDNLGDVNSPSGERKQHFQIKPNNLRDKYEYSCVPISFTSSDTNQLVKSNKNITVILADATEASKDHEGAPRYKEQPLVNGFYIEKHSNIEKEYQHVRKPKINNSVANSAPKSTDSDQIIEDIVLASDINLLATVYNTQMSISEQDITPVKVTVTSGEFLNKLKTLNLGEMLAERNRWMNCGDELGSLLDDILAANSMNECSALDCY